MSPDEMRSTSAQKVKQVMALMKVLHLEVTAKQKITEQGFVENVVFWVDNEQYPSPEPVPTGATGEAPTAEAAPDHV